MIGGTVLKEVQLSCQPGGEPIRRWFSDDHHDLIVWLANDGGIIGFQFCYDKSGDEHALTWLKDKGFAHRRIDDGEGRGLHHKMTPILIPDGIIDIGRIRSLFRLVCGEVDKDIVALVEKRLNELEEKGFKT
jgi:hypothetical protein